MPTIPHEDGPLEIALVGELSQHENDLCDKLLAVPPGGPCILYFNSPGGSAYVALSLATLIVVRGLSATGVVTGECSSAAIWPLAACRRRLVTPHSVLLFHPMKWESEEHVGIKEAAEWARHFGQLEQDMDKLLARMLGVEPPNSRRMAKSGTVCLGLGVCRGRTGRTDRIGFCPAAIPCEASAARTQTAELVALDLTLCSSMLCANRPA